MKTPYEVTMTDSGPRFAVLLGALADGAKRIPIAVVGKFQKGVQRFQISLQTLSYIVANFRRRPIDTEIDFEHASEFPELAQGGPIPAAGWMTAIEDAPDKDGILWGVARFTARAAAMITAQEYRYISPVIDFGARDKRTGEPQGATLVSLALTNRPFLESLPAIAMSANAREQRASVAQMMFLADIETEIAAKRTANKNLDYASAWSLVSSEKPDLIAAYNAAARRVSALRDAGINYAYSR
jgi:phage I-like protein